MKLGAGSLAAIVVTLVVGAAIGIFLHVFVVDLHGNLIGHVAAWSLVLLAAWRLWRAAREFRGLDDDAPTRRLANELPALLERMKAERDAAAAAALRDGAAPETGTGPVVEGTTGPAPEAPAGGDPGVSPSSGPPPGSSPPPSEPPPSPPPR